MSLFNVFQLFVRCCLFLVGCFQDGANCTVVNALKAMTMGKGTGRPDRRTLRWTRRDRRSEMTCSFLWPRWEDTSKES